jgi:hypothetical protein
MDIIRLISGIGTAALGIGVPYVAEGLLAEQQLRFSAGLAFTISGTVCALVAYAHEHRVRPLRLPPLMRCLACDSPMHLVEPTRRSMGAALRCGSCHFICGWPAPKDL